MPTPIRQRPAGETPPRSRRCELTTDFGLDLTGWTPTSATGISWDGTVIVGHGLFARGRSRAS
jgi:hypothetical protein